MAHSVRIGIGGWNFPPWRGVFYPPGLAQSQELRYASGRLGSIEINATFYGAQKPTSFRNWRETTPESFVFAVKGPRFATQRKRLAEAGPSVERFFGGGVRELGPKLGPVLWQLSPYYAFDEADFAAFLALLPTGARHVVEARHKSFAEPAALALLEKRNVALAIVELEKQPEFRQLTADFVYARLKSAVEDEPAGYAPAALDAWAKTISGWAKRGDCFVYVINGAKVRAPAAATALIERVS